MKTKIDVYCYKIYILTNYVQMDKIINSYFCLSLNIILYFYVFIFKFFFILNLLKLKNKSIPLIKYF